MEFRFILVGHYIAENSSPLKLSVIFFETLLYLIPSNQFNMDSLSFGLLKNEYILDEMKLDRF